MRRPSCATLLGLLGLAIIAANAGQRVWHALEAATTPTVHVCAAAHYKLTTNEGGARKWPVFRHAAGGPQGHGGLR